MLLIEALSLFSDENLWRKFGVYFLPSLCYTICSSAGWADPGIFLRDYREYS